MLIKDIAAKQLAPGIWGHYAHGAALTLGYVELDKGSMVPVHQHPHEQITYIIEGQLDMVIAGKPYTLTDGMHFVIPGEVPHSAIAVTPCKVIDVFHPARDDYRV